MNKKAIKNFAINARNKLINDVKYHAGLLGITAEEISDPVKEADGMQVFDMGGYNPFTIYDEQIDQRNSLVKRVKEKGFDNVVEEVAYTWFNRIIAIRFMEVNDYLTTNVRVLSSETEGKIEPNIVTEALNIDLDFTEEDKEKIYQLKDDNKLDELFRLLFIKQCNKLNEILPELFEKTADYTELLLSISFTNEAGVVRQLVDTIEEDDFTDQVEIIGWMYQYYNTEIKDDTFQKLNKNVKISKERIPSVTQLFTPHWIVRYMVENSLGRLWLDGHPNSRIKENWKYYLDEIEQEPEVQLDIENILEKDNILNPEDIKIIDPAMGSGHILVYAFEVLMDIYKSVGYIGSEAATSILENNIYGLDIDNRAYQLSYFALMMKARYYDKEIFMRNIEPQICSIKETNNISEDLIGLIADGDNEVIKNLIYLKKTFINAEIYGSILDVNSIDFDSILNKINKFKTKRYNDFLSFSYQDEVKNLYHILKQAIILSNKYDVVITNPPYMGNRGMNSDLSDYVKKKYPNSNQDMCTVFIERCLKFIGKKSYMSMITQHTFMFTSRYEKLRRKILLNDLVNMIHLGSRAFDEIGGEVVQTTSFILRNTNLNNYKSNFVRLIKYNNQKSKEQAYLNKKHLYTCKKDNFQKVPNCPLAYWLSDSMFTVFEKSEFLADIGKPSRGLATFNDKLFLRFWHEADFNKVKLNTKNTKESLKSEKKWFPYSKGGKYRKWYGNNFMVVNYYKNGIEIKKTGKGAFSNEKYYFKEGLTWSRISTTNFGVRYQNKGFIFGDNGPCIFADEEILYYLLGCLLCKVTQKFLEILNPTMVFQAGDLEKIPIIIDKKQKPRIDKIVFQNIKLSKEEWDSFETSWDFKTHPLMTFKKHTIKSSFEEWKKFTEKIFLDVKSNEETLNKIFINLYNLESELYPEIDDSQITLRKANLSRDIKSFISFAVGCMLGRYSLDEEGLIFAGGQWDPSKYSKCLPDDDNIIPILDSEYFEDDIVGGFLEFVKVTFGEDTLEENLDFIAKALKKKGPTSREVIRNYFLTDFYKDHVKIYKKCPIYWLFDSGKNNGFKALIYMHRYEPDLLARVRTEYLHKTQKAIENAITNNNRIIENSTSAEKSKAVKARDKLVKQLEETKKYDAALAHLANQKIEIEIDDGVKVNYAKFQGVEVSTEGKKSTKINLLTTI